MLTSEPPFRVIRTKQDTSNQTLFKQQILYNKMQHRELHKHKTYSQRLESLSPSPGCSCHLPHLPDTVSKLLTKASGLKFEYV